MSPTKNTVLSRRKGNRDEGWVVEDEGVKVTVNEGKKVVIGDNLSVELCSTKPTDLIRVKNYKIRKVITSMTKTRRGHLGGIDWLKSKHTGIVPESVELIG